MCGFGQAGFLEQGAQLGWAELFFPQCGKVGEVFQPGEMSVKINLLGNVGEVLPGFPRGLGYVDAGNQRSACIWMDESKKTVDGGTFPRAIRAEEGVYFPCLHMEIQRVKGGLVTIALVQLSGA